MLKNDVNLTLIGFFAKNGKNQKKSATFVPFLESTEFLLVFFYIGKRKKNGDRRPLS